MTCKYVWACIDADRLEIRGCFLDSFFTLKNELAYRGEPWKAV